MARNAIKSDFRSYKMAAAGHFVKKIQNKLKLRINGENHIHASKNKTVAICPGCLLELTGLLSI